MKTSSIVLIPAVFALASISATGTLRAQTRLLNAHNNFFLAPGPTDSSSAGAEGQGSNFNPVGIFSSSPFNYSLSVNEGYNDNLFATRTNKNSSFYTNWQGGVDYRFGSPRLQLDAGLTAGATYYYTRPGDSVTYNAALSLSATYLATPRLTLNFNTTTAYVPQDSANTLGGTNQVGNAYFYTDTSLDAAYQWSPKFSTVTGWQIYANYYFDQSSNDTQSFISQTIKQSFRWLLLPKTTIIAEYRANPVVYPGASGMNSFGNFALVGFDQVFNPRFRWTARLGVEQRFNENPVDGNSIYIGPYGETTLSYQFGPTSTLSWNARYGTQPSGLANVTQAQSFVTGLSVSHGFTPRISGSLGANFEVDYFNQSGVISTYTQTIFNVTAGLNFRVNRTVSLSASYQFTDVISPENINVEYTRNIAFAGVNLDF